MKHSACVFWCERHQKQSVATREGSLPARANKGGEGADVRLLSGPSSSSPKRTLPDVPLLDLVSGQWGSLWSLYRGCLLVVEFYLSSMSPRTQVTEIVDSAATTPPSSAVLSSHTCTTPHIHRTVTHTYRGGGL